MAVHTDGNRCLDQAAFIGGCGVIGLVPHIMIAQKAAGCFVELCSAQSPKASAEATAAGDETVVEPRRLKVSFDVFCVWCARQHLESDDDSPAAEAEGETVAEAREGDAASPVSIAPVRLTINTARKTERRVAKEVTHVDTELNEPPSQLAAEELVAAPVPPILASRASMEERYEQLCELVMANRHTGADSLEAEQLGEQLGKL